MKTTYKFSDGETTNEYKIIFDCQPTVEELVHYISLHPVVNETFTITSICTG